MNTPTSLDAKRQAALAYLGNRHVLKGGAVTWNRPTVLPGWIAARNGATQRIAGL